MPPKTRDISEVEIEQVPEDYKRRSRDYGKNNPVAELLINGAVIRVPPDTRFYKLGRYLKTIGYSIKTRRTKEGIVIWVDKTEPSNE
jgi:hypothetical protein